MYSGPGLIDEAPSEKTYALLALRFGSPLSGNLELLISETVTKSIPSARTVRMWSSAPSASGDPFAQIYAFPIHAERIKTPR